MSGLQLIGEGEAGEYSDLRVCMGYKHFGGNKFVIVKMVEGSDFDAPGVRRFGSRSQVPEDTTMEGLKEHAKLLAMKTFERWFEYTMHDYELLDSYAPPRPK